MGLIMKDQLNLKIYAEICKIYIEQIKLNIDEPFFAEKQKHNERFLHKFNYHLYKETVTIEVDGFKCSFNDAFMIKQSFDKIIDKEDRFFYFAELKTLKLVKPLPIVIEIQKQKRVYNKKIKVSIKLPKLTIWQTIKLILKAA